MSRNSGAWGVAMWRDDSFTQGEGISLEGGDEIVPYLPTDPLGCLTLPPDGLGVPGIRNSDVVIAQRDGVSQFEDFYENRILTFRVSICNDGCPGCPTGRAKVKRLLREWSRTCTGATLALFTDCHDPSATLEERMVTGPFLVQGRPRAGDLTWLRSNFGCAQLLLRFDARDHRLVILPPENDGETPWTGVLCEEVFGPSGAEVRTNLIEDPHGRALTWDVAGSTGVITRPTTGGPHNQGYLQYAMTVANSSDPMTIHTAGSGVNGTPVIEGESYTISSYWYMTNNTANDQRYDVTWYNAAGSAISTSTGTDVGIATANTYWRGSQTFVAPALAAFARFTVAWAGIYVTQPSTLRVADILVEHAFREKLFFSGAWLGTWEGTAHASMSATRVKRVNYAWDPRGTNATQWAPTGTGGSVITETLVTAALDGPTIPDTTTDTYVRYTFTTGGAAGTSSVAYSALHVPTEAFEIGDQVTVSVWVRSSFALLSPTVFLSQQVNGADGADVVGAAQANLVANTWTRLSETLTLTAYADGINVAGLQFPGNTIPNGTTVDVGYVLIERAAALDTYFDGSFDEGAWQGAENLSISMLGPDAASLECSTALVLDGVSPGRASTPDTASLDITGDIDLRAHVALDDWTPAGTQALVSKWVTSGNQRSYLFRVNAGGALQLFWSADGTTLLNALSTVNPTVLDGEALWVRATLDVDNGAAGRDVKFYTSTDGVTWTQLGATVTTAGVTSILNSTAEAAVGAIDSGANNRTAGRVFYAEVRNSISGTIVANPDFAAQAAGTTSFIDSTGKTWTIVSPAEIVTTGCPASVTVVGDLCVYPSITLDGPLTGPIKIYYDGNSSVVYGDDVPAGLNNRVVIDAEFLRAYQGSTDVSAALSGVTPSSLPLGTTTITVTTGSPLDSGTVTLCWENAVVSG